MLRKIILSLLLTLPNLVFANLPYTPITFPRDHGAHYGNTPYSIDQLVEWWYFNGKITTEDDKHFGIDIALFNPAKNMGVIITKPAMQIQIADLDEKISDGTSQSFNYNAGKFSTSDLTISLNNNYQLRQETINGKIVYLLNVDNQDASKPLSFDLMLEPISEPFLINDNGLVPMPDNTNSYYYSIPKFKVTGTFKIGDKQYRIGKTPGDFWLDHQWGDFDVSKNGWEWFSMRLDNGLLANIFLNYNYKSHAIIGGLANIILPNGEKRYIDYTHFNITRKDYWLDQSQSISYPTTFTFEFPDIGLEITSTAAFAEQAVHGYWEGYTNLHATYQGKSTDGYSYTELVYTSPVSQ